MLMCNVFTIVHLWARLRESWNVVDVLFYRVIMGKHNYPSEGNDNKALYPLTRSQVFSSR